MTKALRFILVFVLTLAVLFVAAIGTIPVWIPWVLEHELGNSGIQTQEIELTVPNWNSLEVDRWVLQTTLAGEKATITVQRLTLIYQPLNLLKGSLEQMTIRNVSVDLVPISKSRSFHPRSQKPFTIGRFLSSMPILPFRALRIDEFSVHRSPGPGGSPQVSVSGGLTLTDRSLVGEATIRTPTFPQYDIEVSGTLPQQLLIVARSTSSSSTPDINLRAALQPMKERLHVYGRLRTTLQAMMAPLSFLVPISEDLRQATGLLTMEWQGSLPATLPLTPTVGKPRGTGEGRFEVTLNLPTWRETRTDLHASLYGEFSIIDDVLAWSLANRSSISTHLPHESMALPEWVRSLLPPGIPIRLALDLPHTLSGKVTHIFDSPEFLLLEGKLHSRVSIEGLPLRIEGTLSQFRVANAQDFSGKGTFVLTGALPDLAINDIVLKQVSLKWLGEADLTPQDLKAVVRGRSFVDIGSLHLNDVVIPGLRIETKERTLGRIRLDDPSWAVPSIRLDFRMAPFSWKGYRLGFRHGECALRNVQGVPAKVAANGTLRIAGMKVASKERAFPTTNWNLKFSVNSSALQVRFFGRTPGHPLSLYGRARHIWETRHGEGDVKIAPIPFDPTSSIRKVLRPWHIPFDLTAGQATAMARIAWGPPSSHPQTPLRITATEASLELSHLSGQYEAVRFTDLNTSIRLVGPENWSMPESALLTVKAIQAGIQASDLSVAYRLRHNPASPVPLVFIPRLSLHLLGGRVIGEDLEFDASRPRNPLLLRLEHWQLEDILKLEQRDDLQGTGTLDGTLPLSIGQRGIEVRKGLLEARPPGGMIQYRPSQPAAQALASTHSNMDVVLQALRNFHYDVLRVEVDYQMDGTLKLHSTFTGRNPDFQKGRAINLNLTVQENLPALLTSLQITKKIEKEIPHLIQ